MRTLLMPCVIILLGVRGIVAEEAAERPAAALPDCHILHQLHNGTLLFDGQTGETWMLMPDASAWKPVARIVPPPAGTSPPWDADSTSETAKPLPYEVVPRLLEEQLLLEGYGEGHPGVREKCKLIEAVRNLISGKSADGQDVLSEIDQHEKLLPLLIEGHLKLVKYSPDDPHVVTVRRRIESIRNHLQQQGAVVQTER